jgi:hypothetical protein
MGAIVGGAVGAGAGWTGTVGSLGLAVAGSTVALPVLATGAVLGGMLGLAYGMGQKKR